MRSIADLARASIAAGVVAALIAGCEVGGDAAERPAAEGGAPDTAAAPTRGAAMSIADVGLSTPESALHDPDADVYLVSNIEGDPLGKDGAGFIARIRPDGTVDSLRWIRGGRGGVTLNAPKGLALKGDTLFVADIDVIRAFDRTTGRPLGEVPVTGATFLNDLTVGPNDVLYATDSGLTTGFEPSGTDAIYRILNGRAEAIVQDTALARPNGIHAGREALVWVTFGDSRVMRMRRGGTTADTLATLTTGQLDGVVAVDGDLLVSSWEGRSIYRVRPDGTAEQVITEVESPADIGYDAKRGVVLIPLFTQNAIRIAPLGGARGR